jgi:hypothetical protein
MADPECARRAAGERLAAGLLPVLLHRIQNNTQLLVALRSVLDVAPESLTERSGADLSAAGDDAHEQGWLLGVLAGALGADLLLSREEPRGLEPMLRLVRDGLRREGRDIAWRAGEIPSLAVRGELRSGRLCAAFAALAWEAARAIDDGASLELLFEAHGDAAAVRGSGGGGPELEQCFAELAAILPGCALHRDGAAWRLELPVGALRFER